MPVHVSLRITWPEHSATVPGASTYSVPHYNRRRQAPTAGHNRKCCMVAIDRSTRKLVDLSEGIVSREIYLDQSVMLSKNFTNFF